MKLKNKVRSIALIVALLVGAVACSEAADTRKIHVSAANGDDTFPGSSSDPLKTIQAAASMAQPGDVIIVHEGVYRERVNPVRGGTSNDNPITYQAAKGEKVEIKGSEVIKNWTRLSDAAWEVKVPNRIFGDFNPYADTLHGDWFEKGNWCHTGEVYLNNVALTETPQLKNVLSNETSQTPLWFCEVHQDSTRIWANFGQQNPNEELVEINVRKAVFYPDKPQVNYIVVRGFHLSQAATPWVPPTAEQVGLLGTHWSKGWVIENNTISHSKCVGITLGKYGDEWDNKSGSEEGYINTTKRALEHQWDREHVGSHLVQGNRIFSCGQVGIAGSLGAVFSKIEKNVIHDIGVQRNFWGYELAGIKLHAAVDVEIRNNHIYRTEGGIWLDWMTQGTRLTGNLLHDNKVVDLSLEVNHGPILIDHNIFLSQEQGQVKLSQGVAFVNNLIAWKMWEVGTVDERKTPYLEPHGTSIAGYHNCPCGNVSYLNNIFTRADLTPYEECLLPVRMEGNCFWAEAVPSKNEKNPSVSSAFNADIQVIEKSDGWYLQMNLPEDWDKEANREIISTKQLGNAVIPNQSFDKEGGEAIVMDQDYLGKRRHKTNQSCPGPIEFKKGGVQLIKVFDK